MPALTPLQFNTARAELGAQIAAATGCTLEVGGIAAGGFLSFPTDPRHGFGDMWSDKAAVRALHRRAEEALTGWIASAPAMAVAS